jgi:hypothetical protein
MGVDAVQATRALYEIISSGIPADNSLFVLEAASKAAIAGLTDVDTAARVGVAVLNGYGLEVTRLGRRHKAQPVIQGKNPRGETVYWVGPAGAAREAGPGTDFNALERGAVSVTPLQVDLTHGNQIPILNDWIAR